MLAFFHKLGVKSCLLACGVCMSGRNGGDDEIVRAQLLIIV